MNRINIHDAKTNLSRYLAQMEEGETILLCRRNVPIAEIRPLRAARSGPRQIGVGRGDFVLPPEFHGPLPESVLADFEAAGSDAFGDAKAAKPRRRRRPRR